MHDLVHRTNQIQPLADTDAGYRDRIPLPFTYYQLTGFSSVVIRHSFDLTLTSDTLYSFTHQEAVAVVVVVTEGGTHSIVHVLYALPSVSRPQNPTQQQQRLLYYYDRYMPCHCHAMVDRGFFLEYM